MAGAEAAAGAEPEPRIGRLLAWSAVIGIAAAGAAVLFVTVEHWLQHVLWHGLPEQFGWEEPAAWWVVGVLVVGAVLVWLATRLPGHGGHGPLDGFGLDIGPREISSVVLAAMASLAFGAVVGPEAPLVAIGTATAAFLAARGSLASETGILIAAGAMAAIGNIFGNPLVTGILVLEFFVLRGGLGGRTAVTELLPIMTALGFGYLLQVGVTASWDGFGEAVLSVPGLPEYPTVLVRDLVIAVVLAVIVSALTSAAFLLGTRYRAMAQPRPLAGLAAAGAFLAIAALIVRWTTDQPVELVLFSGQSAISQALAITSVGTLIVIAVAKMLAYSVSLGSGFRGGAVFPSVFLGVVLGTATALVIDDASLSAFVAAGIAAGSAASMRLPFTSVLLAVLLCSESGYAITSVAIPAAAVGLLVRAMIDAAVERVPVGDVEKPVEPTPARAEA
jgi:H+/Cl- antiporter ClcA